METPNLFSGIKVVGFDLDQTLYPKSPVIDEMIQSYLYEKIAEHQGVSLTEAEQLFKDRYRNGAGMSGSEALRDLGLENGSNLVQEALERADIASVLSPNDETNAFLEELRTCFGNVDLITGSNLDQTQNKLDALNIPSSLFSHVITADDAPKSTGEAYEHWFTLYPDCSPENFLYIGDRARTDHDAPAMLGIRTCLIYVKSVDPAVSAVQLKDLVELRSVFKEFLTGR